jgi:hypothetical protein
MDLRRAFDGFCQHNWPKRIIADSRIRRVAAPRPTALRTKPRAARAIASSIQCPDRQPQTAQKQCRESVNEVVAFLYVANKHRGLTACSAVPAPVLLRHRQSPARFATILRGTTPHCQARGCQCL